MFKYVFYHKDLADNTLGKDPDQLSEISGSFVCPVKFRITLLHKYTGN